MFRDLEGSNAELVPSSLTVFACYSSSSSFPSQVSDQVIRENPASRGTETSAEVLVGPPWRMESNAGQQQWY
jgi:hypothetical protein